MSERVFVAESFTRQFGSSPRRCVYRLIARNVLGTADEDYQKYYPYSSNRRHFVVPMGLASIIGEPALFSLTNGWAKFYQVDQHRKPLPMESEF